MVSNKFMVVASDKSAIVEIADDAARAATQFGSEKREGTGRDIGAKLWEAMRATGVSTDGVNHIAVFEGDRSGQLLATLHPVMEGARVSWLVLYRANKDSTAFRSLGSRHRLGDAMDVAFEQISEDVVMPHKP